jgi:hypothetical protein
MDDRGLGTEQVPVELEAVSAAASSASRSATGEGMSGPLEQLLEPDVRVEVGAPIVRGGEVRPQLAHLAQEGVRRRHGCWWALSPIASAQ